MARYRITTSGKFWRIERRGLLRWWPVYIDIIGRPISGFYHSWTTYATQERAAEAMSLLPDNGTYQP